MAPASAVQSTRRHPVLPWLSTSASYNPYATIIVTARASDPTPIAVKYVAPKWHIEHADGSVMPPCGVYNVQVIGFSEYFDGGSSSQINGWLDPFVSNSAGISTEGSNLTPGPRNLRFWWQLGNPDEPEERTRFLLKKFLGEWVLSFPALGGIMIILKNQSDQELLFEVERKYSHLLSGIAEEAVDKLNQSFASNSVKQTR